MKIGSGPAAVTGNERRNLPLYEVTVWEGAISRFEPEARRPAFKTKVRVDCAGGAA